MVLNNTKAQPPFSFSFSTYTKKKKGTIKRSRALTKFEEINSLQINLREQFQYLCLSNST